MFLNSSSPSSINIPAGVHEFIQLLSNHSLIDRVYCLKNITEIIELISHKVNTLRKIKQKEIQAIAIVARPYLEKEGQVHIVILQDTFYFYDREGVCVSFVKPRQIIQQLAQDNRLIAIDGVHAGTNIPEMLQGLVNPKIITDKPIYQANYFTAVRQSDVGVKELIGTIWRANSSKFICVMGTAFLWNLVVCNGNRPIPSPEETTIEYLQRKRTDCWLNTHTYRGDSIYHNNQLPSQDLRNQIQANHFFSIKVAGAVRGALYRLTASQPVIIEPHSYSGFSHEFLNQYLHQAPRKNWLEIAKRTRSLRPLVSVLDVQKADQDGYWTSTIEEAEIFYQTFFNILRQYTDKLPPIDNIPRCQNDVYGYGGGILTRLTQVVEQAGNYADVKQEVMSNFYQHNIFTVEIDRLLVQLSEFEDVSSVSKETYWQRCELVAEALIAGIEALLPLMSQRLAHQSKLR